MELMITNALVATSFAGIALPAGIAPWMPVAAVALGGGLLLGLLALGLAAMLVMNSRKRVQ